MTNISTLGAALDQIERIKQQQSLFSSLSVQMSSGKKTQSFTGLGMDRLISKRTRADLKSIDTYITNIDHANRRISLTTNAVNEFKAQAKIFADLLTGLPRQDTHQKGEIVYYDDPLTPDDENLAVGQTSGDPDVEMKTLQDLAGRIFDVLTKILNTQEGERYLFSGAETGTKPFQNKGTLDAALNVLVNDWKAGNISTDNFIADFRDRTTSGGNANALTDTVVGYASSLSAGNAGDVYARVSQTTEIKYTTLGNEQAFRDIIVVAAYIKNADFMPVVDVYKPPNTYPGVPDQKGAPGADAAEQKENFYRVLTELTSMVTGAINDIDAIARNLANSQTRIQQIKKNYGEEKNLLKNTISEVEDIDTNEVALRLTTLQTQLEASFQVTAITQQLTLANYLGFR